MNRKHRDPIAYQFFGFMVQCLNEMPRVKDRSDSFYRRQLFVPFTQCFSGKEKRYIKDDYLHRPEVLQYVLHKVLHMNHYSLSEPQVCREALAEYKEFNDPVRSFCAEFLDQFEWDFVPFTFLYALYKAWWQRNSPSGTPQGRNTFINDILVVIRDNPEWECQDKNRNVSTSTKMDAPEPLIWEYDLKEWMDPHYSGNDILKHCHPLLKATYRGIERTIPKVRKKDDEED